MQLFLIRICTDILKGRIILTNTLKNICGFVDLTILSLNHEPISESHGICRSFFAFLWVSSLDACIKSTLLSKNAAYCLTSASDEDGVNFAHPHLCTYSINLINLLNIPTSSTTISDRCRGGKGKGSFVNRKTGKYLWMRVSPLPLGFASYTLWQRGGADTQTYHYRFLLFWRAKRVRLHKWLMDRRGRWMEGWRGESKHGGKASPAERRIEG